MSVLRIHPCNSKVFEFRGQPLVLLCATEHYGAVINRPFDFAKYLADAHAHKQTLTRLFTLFRELQGDRNPYSTCKPETPDYIAPFKRVGPERALDGGLKYDLSQWNPEFFDRLHRFLSQASEYGIVVEVVLLSNTYADNIWSLNPLHPRNNLQGLEPVDFPDYTSLRHEALWRWQAAHIQRIVTECNRYDNIFFEVCNEPGGCFPGKPQAPTTTEVDKWQQEIIALIRRTEENMPNQHLIAGQEAFTWGPEFNQTSDKTFRELPMDIVNMHPLPNTAYGGIRYDMGNFMAKELKLRALRNFALATRQEPKPLNYDEDNAASQYKDSEGWTIHRKRAWTALLCGAHYDMIDFSILPYLESGTPASQAHIRSWMGYLSTFIHSVDLVRARPLVGWVRGLPEQVVESVLAVPGEDYCIYLADARELDAGVGTALRVGVSLDLPAGSFELAGFSPVTGLCSPALPVDGGNNVKIRVPAFTHDTLVRIRKTGGTS